MAASELSEQPQVAQAWAREGVASSASAPLLSRENRISGFPEFG
jgi:hypothetical protein